MVQIDELCNSKVYYYRYLPKYIFYTYLLNGFYLLTYLKPIVNNDNIDNL